MEKIKILMSHSGTEIEGQGVGAATIEQINLIKEFCSNDFLVLDNKGKADILHVHTIEPKSRRRALRSKNPVVMHVHFLPETLEGSIKLPGFIQRLFHRYFLKIYRKADYLVVVNPIFIDELVTYNIKRENIYYIPNFVSEETFYKLNQNEKNALRKKYNIDENKFTVLGVGQVQTRKGVLDFIEVAKKLPDINFIWAGGFSFGMITDGHKELKKIMENPPENVKFLGIIPRSEMNGIYNMSDLLFMPSYNELFPMAILEAASSGIPMLLRNLELYKDILFGKHLTGKNNKEFVDHINKLSLDKDYFNESASLSDYIKNYYSRKNVSKIWNEFYLKVYNEGKKGSQK